MLTGIAVPLEVAAAAWLGALAVGVLAGRTRQWGHQSAARARPSDPAAPPFRLGRGTASPYQHPVRQDHARQTVLHARIDQIDALRAGWDAQTRAQVLGTIATVMKAGVRQTDSFAEVDGDGFTITMHGTDERGARTVADRLRRALRDMRLPQLRGRNLFTASFGLAAGKAQDGGENLVLRALAALDEAQKAGTDHVVAASDIDDVILLPAPGAANEAA